MKKQYNKQKDLPDHNQEMINPQKGSLSGGESPDKGEKQNQSGGISGLKNNLKLPGGIEMPKGGGAIRGIGEKTEVNPVTGSGSVSVPLPVTPGRSGFTPPLTLQYSSGTGNSEFGLGWNISLSAITRKTDKELPLYHDIEESDTFIFSDAEDLVPVTDGQGRITETSDHDTRIRRYRPRTEGGNALIEKIVIPDGVSFWRITSKENVVSLYGYSEEARVADPEDPTRIFSWKLQYSRDAFGNMIRYNYTKENNGIAYTYLSSVQYANSEPAADILAPCNYLMELRFRYNNERIDAFSVFKPGFEVRNSRLCTSVEMYHHMTANPKVKELILEYDTTSGLSLLKQAELRGYDAANNRETFPPLEFTYTMPRLPDRSKALDSLDLENMPGGINSQVAFSDLLGEGISGVLIKSNRAWHYKTNLGNRKWFDPEDHDEIDLGKMFVLQELPGIAAGNMEAAQLTDIDGDGVNEIQILTGNIKGYHEFNESGELQPFVPFKEMPNIDFNDPGVRMIDLNGDGFPDLLFGGENCFFISYSKNKEGYSELERISKAIDEEQGPKVVFTEQQQTIFIADMSGDGLNDIVRIMNGSICYWPNLGYGRFGKKRPMRNAPRFDHNDLFDPSRLRLADIDGSGTTDILYLGATETVYWKNYSGNGWSEGIIIPNFPSVDSLTDVSVFDIEGNGTSALVWSTPLPGRSERIKYIELTGGKKPFLLHKIDNNMGAISKLYYAPSTKFYLQDQTANKPWWTKEGFPLHKAPKPWITKLGFPVHVVEKIETCDLPSESKFVTRYAYHHGYYDRIEREFRGFGMVEQWDTENYISSDLENYAPPIYTKTWFHNGFFNDHEKISRLYAEEYYQEDPSAWQLEDTLLPVLEMGILPLSPAEKREACRALKGSMLRSEVYALDGSEKQWIPYTVQEKNFQLQCLQRKWNNKHAVFLKSENEQLAYHYERDSADPRILHDLVLQVDTYGNPVKIAQIAYPRRSGAPNSLPEQQKTVLTYTENTFINNESSGCHRIGVPCGILQYEVYNMAISTVKYDKAAVISVIEQAAVINYLEVPGETMPQKKQIQHQKTVFWNQSLTSPLPHGQIAPHGLPYRTSVMEWTPDMISKFNEDGIKITEQMLTASCKYIKEGVNWYSTEDIRTYSPENFYQPVAITDPFGNISTITYDHYKLHPVTLTHPAHYIIRAEYDYRVMQPNKVTDPNGSSKLLVFDALGMPAKLAVKGKLSSEGDTLTEPTEIYEYDLHQWKNHQKPVYSHVLKRKNHGSANNSWLESYHYSDGLGREMMAKITAENGPARTIINDEAAEAECNNRWLSSGKIIHNNKGMPVKQYEPWYSTTHEFENEIRLTKYGVSPVMHYDPLGRVVQTDLPDGTMTRTLYGVWYQEYYDQNDCDTASPHHGTPQIMDFEVLGRTYRITDDNGSYGKYITTNTLDILGRIIRVKNAKNKPMTWNYYTMNGENIFLTENIDSGKRWILSDVKGNPRYRWDSRGQFLSVEYDALLRPVRTKLKKGTAGEITVQEITYGNNSNQNNIGYISEILGQDGKTQFAYDFKGNVISIRKFFPEGIYESDTHIHSMALSGESFISGTTYDALNRVTTINHNNERQVTYEYDKGGTLNKIHSGGQYYITDITYNARGQRTSIIYGNNTATHYKYDPFTFRITKLLTTRNTGQVALQDLNYQYDPVGNITRITDNAQKTLYFGNQQINPVSTYDYDPLYRLTGSTGRELTAITAPNHPDFVNNIPCPADNAVRNYNHAYQYDELGNITRDPWKTYNYTTGNANNYLLGTGSSTNHYGYDAHGNIIKMPHLTTMSWDLQDQLIFAANGNTMKAYYNYDADGNRTRKTVVKGNVREVRYYVNGYEIYRKYTQNTLNLERTTVNVNDERKIFARIEKAYDTVIRYQYDNHLGSACLELDIAGNIISYEEYHPFGTTSYRSGKNETEVSLKRYKYCGKERDEETGLYYYGARYYVAWLCRFVSVDPLQHEYPHYTPYQYAGNKPITYIDLDGLEEAKNDFSFTPADDPTIPINDKISINKKPEFNFPIDEIIGDGGVKFGYEYRRDDDGNYLKNKNGENIIESITMIVTGVVINVSNEDVSLTTAASRISAQIHNSFRGTIDNDIIFRTSINLSTVNSMDDVSEDNVVFALADIKKVDGIRPNGGVNNIYGKVAFIDVDYFNGPLDEFYTNIGPGTAAHEFGHLVGLEHTVGSNLMKQGFGSIFGRYSTKITNEQLKYIHKNRKNLNQGTNRQTTYGKYTGIRTMPNRGLVSRYIPYD